jgi:enoyl-CoA hydratase/carnithine racemase
VIGLRRIGGDELVELLVTDGAAGLRGEGPVVVVEGRPTADPEVRRRAVDALGRVAAVVVGGPGWAGADADDLALVDLVTGDEPGVLDAVAQSVAQHPLAAGALAVHLRGAAERPLTDGLVAESALYSMLQAGPEFRAWRSATAVRHRPPSSTPAVRVERDGDEVAITLSRPEVRNAFNVQMRDELLDAFAVVAADRAVRATVRGDGPAFCSGGDLDEFGTSPDPVSAHAIRLDRSVGAAIAAVADRVTFHLHGACFGSGIELPAFAARVVAAPSTMICLPEVGLGLAPGAGGTVSLTRRIGRHATAWLAFSRVPIGAEQARSWGLVDEISATI